MNRFYFYLQITKYFSSFLKNVSHFTCRLFRILSTSKKTKKCIQIKMRIPGVERQIEILFVMKFNMHHNYLLQSKDCTSQQGFNLINQIILSSFIQSTEGINWRQDTLSANQWTEGLAFYKHSIKLDFSYLFQMIKTMMKDE